MAVALKHPAFVFAAVVATATALVLAISAGFEEKIKRQRADEQRLLIATMLAGVAHDNDIATAWSALSVNTATAHIEAAAFARRGAAAAALIVRARAQKAYGGPITFLLMTTPQADALPRLRVLKHSETPGIADFLNDDDISGVYDGVSGATISAAALARAALDIKQWVAACVRWRQSEIIC